MGVPKGPSVGPNIGNSRNMPTASGAHNFQRSYYKHAGASGDVRAHYEDLEFTSTGAGETLRLRGIANGLLVATGGTVNALHATGRVAAAKTVSGALNAIRATLEVAGTTPTPGGTLAAIQLDSNIVTGATMGAETAFIRVTDSGATAIANLFNLPTLGDGLLTAAHTAQTNTHSIRCRIGGTTYYIPCHSTATGRS